MCLEYEMFANMGFNSTKTIGWALRKKKHHRILVKSKRCRKKRHRFLSCQAHTHVIPYVPSSKMAQVVVSSRGAFR